ncbi:hypothetical protein WT27_17330 [Burkholderia territorii]|uniref:Uncharacterized protein n=1 Tax=Burkholderia territorii TaxID=1503055 RepID=A0A119DL00_9BURK|nr:hypothetical protein [Burkholderia territorii]KVV37672.1 hypothetical protein WT27_17330 [Burkholderia territorii]KVX35229.1 hypothetical protein WT31_00770 [Burkholderia territorii]
MPLVHCSHHGYVGGERVTRAVRDLVNDRANWRDDHGVVPLTLVRDEIEYPGFMLESERGNIADLGGTYEDCDVYRFSDDESMESAIGLLTTTCSACLRELRALSDAG